MEQMFFKKIGCSVFGGKAMKIDGLNLVNQDTAVTPNYELDGKVNSIIIYLNWMNDLIIIGWIDNNYIYWASKTKADDRETNEQIFNRLANGSFETVSQTNKALESIGISYDELNRFYKERFDRGNENGRLFAYGMEGMLMQMQEKCRAREGDGEYLKVLEKYLKRLTKGKNNPYFYEQEYELIQLLKGESYLLLSKNEQVRNIYFLIQQEIRSLYCTYMSAIK